MSRSHQESSGPPISHQRSFLSQAAAKILPSRTVEYDALKSEDEFRLLTLLPGRRGSVIKCVLAHADLEAPPPYEALSYTWGNPKGYWSIHPPSPNLDRVYTINIGNGYIDITYNLEAALQHLRLESQPRSLWIDALCIDQTNNPERSEQVKVMGKIYARASKVLCWLGESDDSVDDAFNAVEELCWAAKICLWQFCANQLYMPLHEVTVDTLQCLIDAPPALSESDYPSNIFDCLKLVTDLPAFKKVLSAISVDFSASDPVNLAITTFGEARSVARSLVSGGKRLSDSPDFPGLCRAIADVFHNRSYWNRLWIIQEILLAKEAVIICGERHISLHKMQLLDVVIAAGKVHHPTKGCDFTAAVELTSCMTPCVSVRQWKDQVITEGLPDFFNMIFYYNGKICSEPRDAIYAILGVSLPLEISVDYDKSIAEAFTEATRAISCQVKNIDILCMTPIEGTRSTEQSCGYYLPSWVPDFSLPLASFDLIFRDRDSKLKPNLYRENWPLGEFDCRPPMDDKHVLRIKGVFCGRIKSAQPRKLTWLRPDLDYGVMTWDEVMSFKSEVYPSHPENLELDDFWRTLLLDQYEHERHSKFRMWRTSDAEQAFLSDLKEAFETKVLPKRLSVLIHQYATAKAFCTTSTGGMAQVEGDVKVGDYIFFPSGATVPSVVRPTNGDETFSRAKMSLGISTFFKFVGGAYVQGYMDRELTARINDIEFTWETIYLI